MQERLESKLEMALCAADLVDLFLIRSAQGQAAGTGAQIRSSACTRVAVRLGEGFGEQLTRACTPSCPRAPMQTAGEFNLRKPFLAPASGQRLQAERRAEIVMERRTSAPCDIPPCCVSAFHPCFPPAHQYYREGRSSREERKERKNRK